MPSVTPSECLFAQRPDYGRWLRQAQPVTGLIQNWRGRDGNDPSGDIAKDAAQRF